MSIASYEKKLEASKKQHEDLQKKLLILKEKNVALEKQRVEQKHGSDQLNEAYKELREKTETSQVSKIKLEQTHVWAIRTLLKIDKVPSCSRNLVIKFQAQQVSGPKYTEMFPRGKPGLAILHVIQTISTHLNTIKDNVKKL